MHNDDDSAKLIKVTTLNLKMNYDGDTLNVPSNTAHFFALYFSVLPKVTIVIVIPFALARHSSLTAPLTFYYLQGPFARACKNKQRKE